MPSLKNYTPLHYPCHNKQYEAARCLLSLGADPLMTNDAGKTPFDFIKDDSMKLELQTFWKTNMATVSTDDSVALDSAQSLALGTSSAVQSRAAEEPTNHRDEVVVLGSAFLIASTQKRLPANDESNPDAALSLKMKAAGEKPKL